MMLKKIGAALPMAAVVALAAWLAGCGGGTAAKPEDPVACAAVVVYAEPVLTISSAVDANTSKPISVVTLGDFARNGVAISNLKFEVEAAKPVNAVVTGSTVTCTVACAMMQQTGQLSFSVDAPGYQTLRVIANAEYATHSGCPTTYSGGTHVNVRLIPV